MLLVRLMIQVSSNTLEANLHEKYLPASKKEPNIRRQPVTSSKLVTIQE